MRLLDTSLHNYPWMSFDSHLGLLKKKKKKTSQVTYSKALISKAICGHACLSRSIVFQKPRESIPVF